MYHLDENGDGTSVVRNLPPADTDKNSDELVAGLEKLAETVRKAIKVIDIKPAKKAKPRARV